MKHAHQTKITGRGQTAIPVAIQTALGAHPGKYLSWKIESTGKCVVSVVDVADDDGAMSMLGFAKTFRKTRATETWMRDLGGAL